MRNVIRKLQARNRVHAIAIALERGEIALDSDPRRAMSPGGAWPADPNERIARLVHDLRTPLTIVQGFAELLGRGAVTLDEERRAEYLGADRGGGAGDEGDLGRRARGPAVRRLSAASTSGSATGQQLSARPPATGGGPRP